MHSLSCFTERYSKSASKVKRDHSQSLKVQSLKVCFTQSQSAKSQKQSQSISRKISQGCFTQSQSAKSPKNKVSQSLKVHSPSCLAVALHVRLSNLKSVLFLEKEDFTKNMLCFTLTLAQIYLNLFPRNIIPRKNSQFFFTLSFSFHMLLILSLATVGLLHC